MRAWDDVDAIALLGCQTKLAQFGCTAFAQLDERLPEQLGPVVDEM